MWFRMLLAGFAFWASMSASEAQQNESGRNDARQSEGGRNEARQNEARQNAAPQDWAPICDTISNFALLTAAGRDRGLPATEAARLAGEQLGRPAILTSDIMNEVAGQMYRTRSGRPEIEAEAMRQLCLTPLRAGNVLTVRPDIPLAALRPIRLNTGSNVVGTSQGEIEFTLTWQDNGGGHGRDVFSARMKGSPRPILIGDEASVSDDPADDYNMRRSIRFAEGRVGDIAGVFLLIADRQGRDGPSPTTYAIHRLVSDVRQDRFVLLDEHILPDQYCNADAALTAASGLPLRASYKGPATPTGCPRSASIR